MKVLYTSPLFFNPETGSYRTFWIDVKGLKYHQKRDNAVLRLQALGGIEAPDTPETRKCMKEIRAAKRAIERNGYFSTSA